MDDLMIKIDNVSKQYMLGQIGGTTLREELQRKAARRRGKEDPTNKIGAREIVPGETFMALDGVSFEVKRGERVGIIGHNGAGKSTLLKLISRITAPTSGAIGLNGRITSMLEVGTGFHRELTGRENIYMNGAILGMTKKEIDAKIEDIIDFSEVRQFIDTPVKRYSSGMYVKLAFSVAAHLDSEIMIMDEVLAVGDMAFQKKCLDKMSDVSRTEGRTILYVSHNMNTIRQLCDRCIVLNRGRVVFNGEVETGIAMYLGTNSESRFQALQIVDDSKREIKPKYGFRIETVECKSKNGVIPFGGKLGFKLTVSNSNIEKRMVLLRIMIDNLQGITVTMSQTEYPIQIPGNGEVVPIEVSINLASIVPGGYRVSFVLYEVNMGADHNLEILRNLYMINITAPEEFNHGVVWNPKWWGYMTNGYLEIKQ